MIVFITYNILFKKYIAHILGYYIMTANKKRNQSEWDYRKRETKDE